MNIYSRMRELRDDNQLTQQQVADILHINRRTYGAYEKGVNAPTPGILIALSDIYKTSIDYILNVTDERKPYPRKK